MPGSPVAGPNVFAVRVHAHRVLRDSWYKAQADAHTPGGARLWFVDNALHGDDERQEFPTGSVSYLGALHEALRSVADWVENGVGPLPDTAYTIDDGQVRVPETAAQRGGVQPVVTLTADVEAGCEAVLRAVAKNLVQLLLPLSFVVSAYWLGLWALLPMLWPGLLFTMMPLIIRRARKPEWVMLVAVVSLACSVSVAAMFTGGGYSPLLYWMIFMVAGLAARFTLRGVVVLASVLVMSAAAAFLFAPRTTPQPAPAIAMCLAAVAVTTAYYMLALGSAEYEQRTAAHIDPLTGLLSRTGMEARIEELLLRAQRTHRPLAVVVCDIDHFKAVNDVYGHQRGDAVLRDTAAVLRLHTRKFELIYRFGGEEFLLVLPDATADEAAHTAERLRRALVEARPGGLDITASFGVCVASDHFDRLFEAADDALYRAKNDGRNRVVVASRSGPAPMSDSGSGPCPVTTG
jgi:diguanylate cyclase (GGDEF)-like protein